MRVLHLASFEGNIGDIANHEGLYLHLKELLQCDFEVEQLSFRLFYKNNQQKKFDKGFVEHANSYDLLIIGGGNFFELCWDYSATGTTFDITNELLKLISTPILIMGIGIDIDKGYSENNIRKFNSFLQTLFSSNKVFFTVRNDGSKNVVNRFFGQYRNNIHVIPDHGFYIADVLDSKGTESNSLPKYIGINVTSDLREVRYKNIEYEKFIKELAVVVNHILDIYDVDVYLFPHIPSDYQAIVDLMKHLNNYYVRTRVSVAPLQIGNELELFKLYKKCKLIVGMRAHLSICTVGLGVPSFAMSSYTKPEYIYNEIGLEDRYLNIRENNFFNELRKEIESNLTDEHYNAEISKRYLGILSELKKQRNEVYQLLNNWFQENGLK